MQVLSNKHFLGREREIKLLKALETSGHSSIVVIHGRRRVGKTALIELVFGERNLLKLEGLEEGSEADQKLEVLRQLSLFLKNHGLANLKAKSWGDIFELLRVPLAKGKWTLYLEELQSMSSYKTKVVAAIKYAWDNFLGRNPQLILVLCGSSPSFMTSAVVNGSALYGRSMCELNIQPFELPQVCSMLGKNANPMDGLIALSTFGGIPEYLKKLPARLPLIQGIASLSFARNGYFVNEFLRIFVSSLDDRPENRLIIEALSQARFLTRTQIGKKIKQKSGSLLSKLLADLGKSGLVGLYTPLSNTNTRSRLQRYEITDPYLQFYYRFIAPIKERIQQGGFDNNPLSALNLPQFEQWLGYSYERWCRKNAHLIARILSFSAVQYRSGPVFNRAAESSIPGYQIDLAFERADRVYSICEIKFSRSKITSAVVEEFEKKLELFKTRFQFRRRTSI